MRGNIGKPGAGIFPVRGHSNVQGQRTVGITEKPELVPLDKLPSCTASSRRARRGLNTVEACEGVLDRQRQGVRRARRQLRPRHPRDRRHGARLAPAAPHGADRHQAQPQPLIHGKVAYLLPCLGRIEIDRQATGAQSVSIEDTTGRFHASHGQVEPASEHLLSEPTIVAELAKATPAA